MATMVNTGVSLLDALDVMKLSCENYYFRHLWAAADARIRDGYQLSEAILLAPYSELIAPGIIQMLKAGEKSGQLGRVCDKVSIFYEKKLQNSIRTATALIEPLMITVMGGVIGTIAIALLLPVLCRPAPLPAVLLASRGRTPSSNRAARRRRGVFHCRHRAARNRSRTQRVRDTSTSGVSQKPK